MTYAEARCNKSLRPRKPEGSLGRTAQDVHLDSHTAPELCEPGLCSQSSLYTDPQDNAGNISGVFPDHLNSYFCRAASVMIETDNSQN